jgi:hypothetical protein
MQLFNWSVDLDEILRGVDIEGDLDAIFSNPIA